MKYLLLIILIFISLFSSYPVYAQTISPVFYCIGSNPQPPCITRVPSPSQGAVSITPTLFITSPSPSILPSVSPSVSPSTSPSTSPSPSPSTAPCQNTSITSVNNIQTAAKKKHLTTNGW